MILVYFLTKPILWVVPWVLQAIGYFFILKKMGLVKKTCVIPFLAERQMTKKLFSRMRSFYRPFVVASVMMLAGWYLDSSEGLGRVFSYVALLVYGVFLLRLYWRLTKSLGRGRLFYLGLIFFPPLFLVILGFSGRPYRPLDLKPVKDHGKVGNFLRRSALVFISVVEITVLIVGVGLLTVRSLPPTLLVSWQNGKIEEGLKSVKPDDEFITREEMMGKAEASLDDMKPSREKFFPDHSQDRNVVVLTYVVGSDLEKKMGLASANIRQMVEATKQGDHLTFAMEAGGSDRWFTRQIENSSYGRYEIRDGKIEKVESLPDDTCMSEGKTLAEFLKWGKENYPADRYMLVLWDHGGGVAYGYGIDDVNEPGGSADIMAVSQLVRAIASSEMKFDMIGFDACLMQDIEVAASMEPFADYYLASEEVEGGYGWYYTDAFGKLAKDPGTPTEELGKIILSTYDQLNTIVKDDHGRPDTNATLSLVDTTLARPACDRLGELLKKAEEAVREDPGAYGSIAAAANNAYNFNGNTQIDLVDYLTILKKADYGDLIGSDGEIQTVIDSVRACVLMRNKDSAEGINGMAFAFPYRSLSAYSDTSKQLKALSMKEEKSAFDVIFSIMAAQQVKAMKDPDYAKDMLQNAAGESGPMGTLSNLMLTDPAEEDWYVKGFEDYDTSEALVDIPLKETAEGYAIQAPEKIWNIITDTQTMVYRETGKGKGERVYLGRDHIGSEDEKGHPLIAVDENWIHIGGRLVCYEADPVKETEKGDVHSGKVRARLNDTTDVLLNVEWDPVKEGQDPEEGHVTGYTLAADNLMSGILNSRGEKDLEAGDTLRFIFETYDGEGNPVKTGPAGKKLRITKQSRLKVEDAPMGEGSLSVGGVMTDIYQRTMTTELVEVEL